LGLISNTPELSVPSVHDGGALVAFGSGVVYIALQSVISFKSCPQWNSHCTCYIRMAISIVSCIAVIPMIACASLISITKVDWIPGEKLWSLFYCTFSASLIKALPLIKHLGSDPEPFAVNSSLSTNLNGQWIRILEHLW
uniref:DNA damage regulated autophagy modulator 1 n=1 Tax=Terrapene triunguis TaxID=2587831 RepID=A0A674K526_9SAUR